MAEYSSISSMNEAVPQGTGQLSQADDHMRGIKSAIKNTLPAIDSVVTATSADLNSLAGYAASSGDVWDKIQANETWRGTITADQLNALSDVYKNSNQTIDYRLNELEVKLQDVDQLTISGALVGYDYANQDTVEQRFIEHRSIINAIIGDTSGVPAQSIATIWNLMVGPGGIQYWQAEREAAATNNQLGAIKTFHGVSGLTQYGYQNDLGHDFLRIAEKVNALEILVNRGGVPGDITWMTLISNLNNGQGGINVTNVIDATDRFGFIMTGLEPGSYVDFWFTDAVLNASGQRASVVNPDKLVMVSNTGEAFVNLSLGGPSGKNNFGPNDSRLTPNNHGTITVQGQWINPTTGLPVTETRYMFCYFYDQFA